jgi:asparagine synthase (glutamine-hydrolysing)
MCGIAGIIRLLGPTTAEDVSAVQRMTAAQAHRGPNDSGFYHDSRVVFGHRRLSIIDVTAAGHQPLSNEDETVWVVYNGEIYNYRELQAELKMRGHSLRSNSDTEVLVHGYEEWGVDGLLSRLRGMFAFALYDVRNGQCLLARDRFGIKPLYYFKSPLGEFLVFASEVKTLLRSGLVPDDKDRLGVSGFLLLGSVPAPSTWIRNVRCLLPGHSLQTGHASIHARKYPDFSGEGSAAGVDLRQALEDSVLRQLVSDVPIGVFLSGGVDSASIAALARRAQAKLSTLTVVFEEREYSEAASAQRIAARFGADHQEVRITGDDFAREIPNVLLAMDQPTNDGLNTWFVSKAARQAGLTVVLSGLGGDELFWGYEHYRWLATWKDPFRLLAALPESLRSVAIRAAMAYGAVRRRESWARLSFIAGRLTNDSVYAALRGFFPGDQVARLLDMNSAELKTMIEQVVFNKWTASGGVPLTADAFNLIEIRRYMHDQLLRDADVFSMANSVEVRVPLLDEVVARLASLAGAAGKRATKINKPLLVNAVGDPLVTELAAYPKRGFTFPFAKWMRERTASLEDIAMGGRLLNPAVVHSMWQRFNRGQLHWSRAWATVVLAARPGVGL